MDLTLLQEKDTFLRFVKDKLATVPVDYKEKNLQIEKASQNGSRNLKAGVVLLLHFKTIQGKSEYVFQLIKRSEKVSQSGDISCPGGMLQPRLDNILSCFLKTGIHSRRAESNCKPYPTGRQRNNISDPPVFIHRLERSMGRSRFKSF